MNTKSCKAKARALQNETARVLRTHYELADDDVKPAIMGESGVDIKLSPTAKKVVPFDVECKNKEALNVWSALNQAEENSTEGRTPMLVFKRNHTKIYVALEIRDFMRLLE